MQAGTRSVTLLAAAAAVSALAYYGFSLTRRNAPLPAVAAALPPKPAASTLADPLRPDAPAALDLARAKASNWVSARPAFQASRSSAERGGVEPCATQAVDASGFEGWLPLSRGRLSWPRSWATSQASEVDLIIHLHGDEPVRRELIESGASIALLAVTLGASQSYAPLFNGPSLYRAMVAEAAQAMSKRLARPLRVRSVALSAWSAGFVGVESALFQPESRDVDAVVLIDGLHAPRKDRAAFEAQLKPFVDYARRAASGQGFMFISHSSIDPPDFASTTETAHYLIAALGAQPQAVRRSDRFGLELVELFSQGDLHARGYAGNDKADHCAQLALLRDVYRVLGQRWATR